MSANTEHNKSESSANATAGRINIDKSQIKTSSVRETDCLSHVLAYEQSDFEAGNSLFSVCYFFRCS